MTLFTGILLLINGMLCGTIYVQFRNKRYADQQISRCRDKSLEIATMADKEIKTLTADLNIERATTNVLRTTADLRGSQIDAVKVYLKLGEPKIALKLLDIMGDSEAFQAYNEAAMKELRPEG